MRIPMALFILLIPLLSHSQNDGVAALKDNQEKIKQLEDRLSKLESAPAKNSLSAFNPALGLAMDMLYSHQDKKGQLNLRSAELNIEAPIDPFLKGWTIITGSNDGIELEEATLETTSLPYGLTARAGRLFVDFGRLAHFHDHELPVTERPRSLNTFISGEARGDGIEMSYLFPFDNYVHASFGVYNKIGADNKRTADMDSRPLDQFTYLYRLSTYQDLSVNHSIELGASIAWTPKRTVVEDTAVTGSLFPALITQNNTWRTVTAVDMTYRYQPAQGGMYKGVIWGTEVMQNNERRFDSNTNLPTDRVRSYAGFSYIELKMGRRWRPGVMVDLTEDLDHARQIWQTYTSTLTYDISEFNRLRVSYSRVNNNVPGMPGNNIVALQWTAVLGHHVHGFRDR